PNDDRLTTITASRTPASRGRDHPGIRGRNNLGTKGRLHRNRQPVFGTEDYDLMDVEKPDNAPISVSGSA
ncbi:hypothetical protein, partial [Rhizobium sp. R693]|uniref:hypothetical protein n=1 Tax=Rhizobium sp. R693 TaxID=1764276 RepID=UPI001AEF86CA